MTRACERERTFSAWVKQGVLAAACLEVGTLSNEAVVNRRPRPCHVFCACTAHARPAIRDATLFAIYAVMSAGANSALVSAVCAFVLAQSLKVLTHRRVGCSAGLGWKRFFGSARSCSRSRPGRTQSERRQVGCATDCHLGRDAVLALCAGAFRGACG